MTGEYAGTAQVEYISQVTYGELGFPTQVAYDGYIAGTLIPQCENVVDTYCGGRVGMARRFNLNYGSLTVDGMGRSVVFIPDNYTPWVSLGTLTSMGGTVIGPGVSNPNIVVHPQYIEWWNGVFIRWAHSVTLIGSYGFTEVPQDISYITAQVAANALLDAKRRKGSDAVKGITGASGGMTFMTALANPQLLAGDWLLTDKQKADLNYYRVRWVDAG